MKDRPCNIEGLEDPSPASKVLDPSQYMLKIYPKSRPAGPVLYPLFPNLSGKQTEWYKSRFDQTPIDFRKCKQDGGKCINCDSIAKATSGRCPDYIDGQEYNFDLNSYNAKNKSYTYAKAGDGCDGGECGIICESQGPQDIKTPGVGFPQGQNGLFCKV